MSVVGKRWERVRKQYLPAHAFAATVAGKTQETVLLTPIQPLDRIVQAVFGSDFPCRRKWVVDPAGPALFLKCQEYDGLIR